METSEIGGVVTGTKGLFVNLYSGNLMLAAWSLLSNDYKVYHPTDELVWAINPRCRSKLTYHLNEETLYVF